MDLTDNEIIQVNITGYDKPGLTTALTDILAKYDAFILDIGQANIHQTLTMGILFSTERDKSGFIMKDLLFKASELGVQIGFKAIDPSDYEQWVGRQGNLLRKAHIGEIQSSLWPDDMRIACAAAGIELV